MHPALHPHQRLHEIFRKHGLARPSTALEARSVAPRLRTIASSDLLDWTSRQFVEQSALAGALKILNIKEMARLRPIGVVCRQENCLPPAVGRFIDIIRRMTKQMVALRCLRHARRLDVAAQYLHYGYSVDLSNVRM